MTTNYWPDHLHSGVGGGVGGEGEVGIRAQTTSTQRADAHMSRRPRVTKNKH